MEPTTKLIIALLVAYAPFIWYFIALAYKMMNLTESEIRARERNETHYWGE